MAEKPYRPSSGAADDSSSDGASRRPAGGSRPPTRTGMQPADSSEGRPARQPTRAGMQPVDALEGRSARPPTRAGMPAVDALEGRSPRPPTRSAMRAVDDPVVASPRDSTRLLDVNTLEGAAARGEHADGLDVPAVASPRDSTRLLDVSTLEAVADRPSGDSLAPPVGPEARGETRVLDIAELEAGARPQRSSAAPAVAPPSAALPPSSRARAQEPAAEFGTAWSNPKVQLTITVAVLAAAVLGMWQVLAHMYEESDRPTARELIYLYPYRELQTLAPGRTIPQGYQVKFAFEEEVDCPDGSSGCLRYGFKTDGDFYGTMVVHRAVPGGEWVRAVEPRAQGSSR